METAWYFRHFYIPVLSFIISWFLFSIIRAKRMTGPGPGRAGVMVYWTSLVAMCALMWFVPFRINLAFWLGLGIIIFGEVVYALGYSAMREHPERKRAVVDWGIYRVSRHSHVLAGLTTTLGTVIMGWNPASMTYLILWVYFVLDIILSHFGLLSEEKINIEKFGQEYADYMKSVPRYFLIK